MPDLAKFFDSLSPNASAALAAVAAVVSAITALVGVGFTVWTWQRSNRPQIRVVVAMQFPVFGPTLGDPWLAIVVQNRGLLPVTLTSAAFEVSGNRTAPIMAPRTPTGQQALPHRLEPGDSLSIVEDLKLVARAHVADGPFLRAVVNSATGQSYRRRIKDSWLRGWANAA